MEWMELSFLAIGIASGVIVGMVGSYIYFTRGKKPEATGKVERTAVGGVVPKVVQRPELERARRELKTQLLEKELLASALTRLYEAESDGRITRAEREQLSVKYRDQLKALEEKLENAELFIEVGELENLREELHSLFERKMGQLDERLQRAKARLDELQPMRAAPKREVEKPVEKEVEKPRVKVETEVDARVKVLRDEVLEALTRLEQIDVEG